MPVAAEVVAADEPGVEPGQHVAGVAVQLVVDDDDGGAEDAAPVGGRRTEALERQRAAHGVLRDADLGGRGDERVGVDAVGVGQPAGLGALELDGAAQDAPDGVPVEPHGVHDAEARAVRSGGEAVGARAAEQHVDGVDPEVVVVAAGSCGVPTAAGSTSKSAPHVVHSRWWCGVTPPLGS